MAKFEDGDEVRKVSGYEFDSVVVAVFEKLNGETRIVCEDDRGLLHIFNESQMELRYDENDPHGGPSW